MRKLPKNLNVALTGSNLSDINELIKLADNLWEILYNSEINYLKASPSDSRTFNTNDFGKILQNLTQVTTDIAEHFKTLSLEVSSIKRQMEEETFQPRFRQFNRNRSRSRARSTNRNLLCKFHYRYGSRARNCEQPCSYSTQNETQKN